MSTAAATPYGARIVVAPSKSEIPPALHRPIVEACSSALNERNVFVIALSGGSLPSFLSTLSDAFEESGVDPSYDKWRVLLADERCVPSTHGDSNIKALRENFLGKVPVPPERVYGIDESLLSDGHSTAEVADEYERRALMPILAESGGKIDVAVLGFGPDGHTCSLFPGHDLLTEEGRLVAPIEDSPKPPPVGSPSPSPSSTA